MKMIIIEGIENAGKTTFCRELLSRMYRLECFERFLCERQDEENNWFDYNEEKLNGVDFMAIFEYAGKNIGLISHADNLEAFTRGYERLKEKDNNKGFDYLICCSRTKNCKNSVKRYLCETFKDEEKITIEEKKTIKVIYNKNENRTYKYEGNENATVEEAVNFVIKELRKQ
ncbi:MAG: hypothetical protein UF067_09390 [Paludibacteraceae bacterium]|nr:hypothetical protein [Paludibacteraceae bacterium]